MVITLTGDNDFAVGKALRALVRDFSKEYGDFAIEQIDAEEVELNRISEGLQSQPFLSTKKLVVLHNPSRNKDFTESFAQILTEVSDAADLLIVEAKMDKRLGLYKQLKKESDFREFNSQDAAGLGKWLSEEAKQRGANLSFKDANYLIERVGPNQRLLNSELDKLVIYDTDITEGTINLLTEPSPQSSIFQLIDAAFGDNKKRTLELYHEQRELKVEPQQIIAMLAWQLHSLAVVKTTHQANVATIAKEAKLNPYTVRKSLAMAAHISLADLKLCITKLLQIDLKLKTKNIDADEALELYLINLGA